MSKLLVLVMLVYFYFNINEFLVPAYKMKAGEDHHILTLFTGHYAPMFWSVQILGLILPILLLFSKKMRKPLPAMIISIFVIIAAFFKRFLITIPTLLHPHLPVQNVPDSFKEYWPTTTEWAVTAMSIAAAVLIITILAKLFPIMPIWEVAHEKGVRLEDINEFEGLDNDVKNT